MGANDLRAAAGRAKPNRKSYWRVWGALLVLTVLEVGVAYLEQYIAKTALVAALIGLAVTKAGAVALFFMHLEHESRATRWTVLFPMVLPALFAFALIADGMYRALWRWP